MSIPELYAEHLVNTTIDKAIRLTQSVSLLDSQSSSISSISNQTLLLSSTTPSSTITNTNMAKEFILFGAGPAKLPREVSISL